jgi:hypothetical protein
MSKKKIQPQKCISQQTETNWNRNIQLTILVQTNKYKCKITYWQNIKYILTENRKYENEET